MATIQKFYLHDAATPNTGTMPSGALITTAGGLTATTGDASGARTARDATDTIGASNPDVESTVTSNADTTQQSWGHRRFVSRPLAAQTIPFSSSASWTFSYARTESNLNHNQAIRVVVYCWRPTSGAVVGSFASSNATNNAGNEPTAAAAEQAESITQPGQGFDVTCQDGDILVFDVSTAFLQGMATAYTEQFAYDGDAEASTTACASFVSLSTPLTLFAAGAAGKAPPPPNRLGRDVLLRM